MRFWAMIVGDNPTELLEPFRWREDGEYYNDGQFDYIAGMYNDALRNGRLKLFPGTQPFEENFEQDCDPNSDEILKIIQEGAHADMARRKDIANWEEITNCCHVVVYNGIWYNSWDEQYRIVNLGAEKDFCECSPLDFKKELPSILSSIKDDDIITIYSMHS